MTKELDLVGAYMTMLIEAEKIKSERDKLARELEKYAGTPGLHALIIKIQLERDQLARVVLDACNGVEPSGYDLELAQRILGFDAPLVKGAAPFDWAEAKPGMAFLFSDQGEDLIVHYVGPYIGESNKVYIRFKQTGQPYKVDYTYKHYIGTRAPEHDIEVSK